MADQHDGLVGMPRTAPGARHWRRAPRRSCNNSPFGKTDEMRRRKPCGEQRRILRFGVGEGFELPGAVIDIVEIVAGFGGDAAGFGDGGRGFDAAAHRAGIDAVRPPGAGDALRDRLRLRAAARGEIERLPAAEPLRLDAFDVAVAGQQDRWSAIRLFPVQPFKDRAAHQPHGMPPRHLQKFAACGDAPQCAIR